MVGEVGGGSPLQVRFDRQPDSMLVFVVGWACFSLLDPGLFLYVPDMSQRLGCEAKVSCRVYAARIRLLV